MHMKSLFAVLGFVSLSCAPHGVATSQRKAQTSRVESPALVLVVEDRTFTRVDSSGARPLFTFGEGIDAEFVKILHWDVHGDVVGGVAFLPSGKVLTYEYALVSPEGKVMFHERRVEPGNPMVYFGSDGSLAAAGGRGFVARPDGTITDLGPLMPLSPVLPGGSLVVTRGHSWEAGSVPLLWKNGTVEPLPVPLERDVHPSVAGGRALVVAGDHLVSLADGRSIRLPTHDLRIVDAHQERWVLLGTNQGVAVVVDVRERTATSVSNLPPPVSPYADRNLLMGADGSVLATTVIDGRLQVRRSRDGGGTWSDVGQPMQADDHYGGGGWLRTVEHQDGVLVLNISSGYGHFVNEMQLVTRSGARRLAMGGVHMLDEHSTGAAALSADGRFVAAWVNRGHGLADLVLLDATGSQRVLLKNSRPGLLRFLP